jgi:pSer/pThr/pTyr-binding forkhead associated (FHA) protein
METDTMDSSLTLHAVTGPLAGRDYVVPVPGSCLIGRSQDCDLSLPDGPTARVISRQHCRVSMTQSGALVQDLGSRNGTFVNGKRIGRRPADCRANEWLADGASRALADGDLLRVGESVFRIVIAAEAPSELLCAAAV